MGGCCGGGDEKNSSINNYLSEAEDDDERVFKLLLLGPGATGKSTLFKSLQILHTGSIKVNEKQSIIHFIRQNILNSICVLLEQSNTLYQSDNALYSDCHMDMTKLPDELQTHIEDILDFKGRAGFVDESKFEYNELANLAQKILTLWNAPFIQATYKNRGGNFVFDDNMDYFFKNVQHIMAPEYLPSDEDCLKNRIKTSGMIQYEYQPEKKSHNRFKIVDVGGQRAERSKWINLFDNVHALLFVASLIDYNTVLYEDDSANGMRESVDLFAETTEKKVFRNCALILILNKDDLLRRLLESNDNGLARCFSEKGQWPEAKEYWDTSVDEQYRKQEITLDEYHDKVVDFVANLFESRNNLRTRCYQHVTIATENKVVEHVFRDIQSIMVQNAMKLSGFVGANADL